MDQRNAKMPLGLQAPETGAEQGMTDSAPPPPLAHQIARYIRDERLPPGTHLSERALAQQFRLSRSPVRAALQALEQAGVLAPAPRGGLAVADAALAEGMARSIPPPDPTEAAYLAIARDRLAGQIPDRISENELLRRYALTRPRLQSLLHRIADEGWIERLPGHGWQFQPVLTSLEAYRQSYSFRQAIEPAALREPGYTAARAGLERHLAQQRALVAGEILSCSAVELFQTNSALHEAITEGSGNSFFIDSLRRVNRLRRLLEYRLVVDREQARLRCAEHVQILEMILSGDPLAAATMMQDHLANLGPIKARSAEAPEG